MNWNEARHLARKMLDETRAPGHHAHLFADGSVTRSLGSGYGGEADEHGKAVAPVFSLDHAASDLAGWGDIVNDEAEWEEYCDAYLDDVAGEITGAFSQERVR